MLRQSYWETMDPDIRYALELLGDPAMVQHPVHTPQVAGVTDREMAQKTYRWFVANDRSPGQRQFLKPIVKPITKDTKELPSLER